MATFQIHQDEKENATKLLGNKNQNVQVGKDKRSTFTVLNNVANTSRTQQGKTTFRNFKPYVAGKVNNENIFANGKIQEKNTITPKTTAANVSIASTSVNNQQIAPVPAPVEHVKFFTVFEDNESSSKENNDIKTHLDESFQSSINSSRDPLKDITLRDGILETPMSVSDVLISPMSIDKSSISKITESANKKTIKKHQINNRERFFEVQEYQLDILEYFREIEKKHRAKPLYMNRQPDINYSMRTILVDWLVEVSEEYRLHTETLFLAISYIDRFLSYMSVVRAKLQLVGTAAMFLAAKYEEIYPPDVSEFVFITDDTYTKSQVLRMEQIMLKILSFNLCSPNSNEFINTYAVLYKMEDKVKFLAIYIAELALLEGDPYLQYLPSKISSASVALARYTLNMPMWDNELEIISSYKLLELKEVLLHLCRSHNLAVNLPQQAIQEKYKHNKYLEVAKLNPIELNSENIDKIISEQQKLIDIEKSFEEEDGAVGGTIGLAASNNESVRKMISSLMFV